MTKFDIEMTRFDSEEDTSYKSFMIEKTDRHEDVEESVIEIFISVVKYFFKSMKT